MMTTRLHGLIELPKLILLVRREYDADGVGVEESASNWRYRYQDGEDPGALPC